MKKQIQFEAYILWLDVPKAERNPSTKEGFSNVHKVSMVTLCKWDKILANEKVDPEAEEIAEFMRNLTTDAKKKDAKAKDRELYAKIKGLLIDRSEVKHQFELSADEYSRIGIKIIERLRDNLRECGGVCPVCSEHLLLPDKIREDTG